MSSFFGKKSLFFEKSLGVDVRWITIVIHFTYDKLHQSWKIVANIASTTSVHISDVVAVHHSDFHCIRVFWVVRLMFHVQRVAHLQGAGGFLVFLRAEEKPFYGEVGYIAFHAIYFVRPNFNYRKSKVTEMLCTVVLLIRFLISGFRVRGNQESSDKR